MTAATPESPESPESHRIATADAGKFIFAGNAVFTVVSKKTGARVTYRVQAPKLDKDGNPVDKSATPIRFVSVLTGPNNTKDFSYLGFVVGGKTYRHGGAKAKVPASATSAVAFDFLMRAVINGGREDAVEIYHEGRCGRCARRLTVPGSILTGLGPECATK